MPNYLYHQNQTVTPTPTTSHLPDIVADREAAYYYYDYYDADYDYYCNNAGEYMAVDKWNICHW